MRNSLTSRIIGLFVLYCVVFFALVLLQFSNKGNFSLSAGGMTIRGSYLQASQINSSLAADEIPVDAHDFSSNNDWLEITRGIKIYFSGLEFNLSEERGKGLKLSGTDGTVCVEPGYLLHKDNTARFGLPGGTVLVFNSLDSPKGPELQISAEFAENISEITIPITPRRSSLVRDNGQLGIMYGGSLYLFSSPGQHLEEGRLILSKENSFISFRSRGKQSVLEPADYVTVKSQDYEKIVLDWRDSIFTQRNQNPAFLQNEDDIIAYCSEALARGNYSAAVAAIPRDFINSARHSHRSAAYIGGMSNAYRMFTASENEKFSLITRLIRERSLDILKEEHILDYLFTRNYTALANDVIDIIVNADPQMLYSDYCPGILEVYSDMKRWRPMTNNPAEHLTDHALLIVLENLSRDLENDLVLASNSEGMNLNYNMRLGKALISWAEGNQNAEWAAIGKSLVVSAVTDTDSSAAGLYNILNPVNNYPRAQWLTDSHWAWTISYSIGAAYAEGNLNISVSFPLSMSHYVIIRGVRPFIKIQIHGMDWRTDSQFERYDSSGWIYYPQDQILILKLRHRETLENVKVFYVEEAPQPAIEETDETGETAPS